MTNSTRRTAPSGRGVPPADMRLTGTRWEIYGDWRDNPQELETEINYLIR
jgi:hypothetical protein